MPGGLRAFVVAAACQLLLWPGARGRRQGIVSIKTKGNFNLAAELQHSIQSGTTSLADTCTMEPSVFVPEEHFYVFTCLHTAKTVDLMIESNGNLFMGGADAGLPIFGGVVPVELPQYEEPHIVKVVSCNNETFSPNSDCDKYTFDVYRSGGDLAYLAMLGVAASGTSPMHLTPKFDPHTLQYATKATLGQAFSITASSAKYKSLVGIEYASGNAALSGLGAQNGCHLGLRKHMRWDLPGFPSTGVHVYTICAIAPNHESMLRYTLNVSVVPLYSEELAGLSVEPYGLEQKFDPGNSIYEVIIPKSRYKMQTTVTVKAKANDTEAKIRFELNGKEKGNESSGENTVDVTTKDNTHLKEGETPEWTRALTIKVVSADGRKSKSYMLKVRQEVSTYCYLKDLEMVDMNCSLVRLEDFGQPDLGENNTVGFEPNNTKYKCVWNYATGERAHIKATKDMEKCADCEIRIPDPDQAKDNKLYLSYWLRKRIAWHELPLDKHKDRTWNRKFLFGAYYTLPIEVVSADKFTSCLYEIYLERWAPWYMRVSTTRFVSKTSITLSSIMAFTGAANVIALAKQVQFMSLTVEIDNVPEVYKDYADTLAAFNLEVSDYLPNMGLPTKEDFKRYKLRMLEYLKVHSGVQNVQLLVQYCYADAEWGRLAGNAILHEHPEDTKALLKHGKEDFGCKQHTRGICKKIADKKAKEAAKAKEEAEGGGDEDAESTTARRLQQGGRAMLRGTVRGLWQVYTALGGEDEPSTRGDRAGEGPRPPEYAAAERRLQEKMRRLGDDDSVVDEEHYPDVWMWEDAKWEEFIKTAKKNYSITKTSYPTLPCQEPLLKQALRAVIFVHRMHQIRAMLHSTTGSFLLILAGFIVSGTIYIIYWSMFMKGNQRRARILEPGQFWLFVMDYALIGFSKKAADLCFRDSLITFFVFKPRRWMTRTFCCVALIAYPFAFTMLVMWSILKVTSAMCFSSSRPKLVFNSGREQWMDPECNDMKVTIEPKIPRSVPIIPQLITQHVRACVPVLDGDGEKLCFDEDEREYAADGESFEKKGALLKKKKIAKKKSMMEDKVGHQRELKRMDDLIQDELKTLSSTHNQNKMQSRLKRLQKEAEQAKKESDWKSQHLKMMESRRKRLSDMLMAGASNTEPPWFAVAGNKEHIPGKKLSGDNRDPNYSNVNMLDLSQKWQPKKGRADNETLDNEEKFAIMQYIETYMRNEKKLLKYNILSVVLHHGFMKPKEPLKIEAKMSTKVKVVKVTDASVNLTAKKQGNLVKLESVPDEWGRKEDVKAGDEILKINGEEVATYSAETIKDKLNKRPCEITFDASEEQLWLPTKEDYLREDYEYGHHPMLEEFMPGSNYLENDRGERLIYEGDSSAVLGWVKCGRGVAAGTCKWIGEPEVGWAIWEENSRSGKHKARYADKWQWIYLDYPDLPWNKDEDGEEMCCDNTNCAFPKKSVILYNEVRASAYKYYKDRVPSIMPIQEKIEIRKWLWQKLRPPMEMKLQLSIIADSHPKYCRERTLMDVAPKDFHQVLFEVETAKPSQEWMDEFRPEGDKATGDGAMKKTFTTELASRLKRKSGVQQANKHELLEYTIMKFEDQFPFDTEPWWAEANERAKERGQVKVMFDHDLFWKSAGDPRLDAVREDNDLVPENGYGSSTMFLEHSAEVVGTKRYQFMKPDSTMTPVSCNLTMGNVPVLMRYTNRFKANVPIDSLDLPQRSTWQIVVNEKKRGEEFNYVVDRGTTLISIICISGNAGGLRTACVFLTMKFITLLNQLWTSFKSTRAANDEKAAEKAKEAIAKQAAAAASASPVKRGESEPLLEKTPSEKTKKKKINMSEFRQPLWKEILLSFKQVDVGVLILQCITLTLLAFGQPCVPNHIPENLCAFACIIVASFTMIFMNVLTFSSELKKMFKEWSEWAQNLDVARRNAWYQIKEFLGGENPLGIQLISVDLAATQQIISAKKIAVVVQDLGIHLSGGPDVGENAPLDEKRAMELLKKISFHVLHRENADDVRPKSIRDHARFEKDIQATLSVALSVDQMMMYAKIPPIEAVIQCVNHTNCNLSRPQYDNYLTLFKPEDWEPEFDQDSAKVEKMLDGWRGQVHNWFKESLGAVESERTCTTEIEEQLNNILKKECTGALHREVVCLDISTIIIPAKGSRKMNDLLDKSGYVSVIYETEKLSADFPTNRMSAFGKFERYRPGDDDAPGMAMMRTSSKAAEAVVLEDPIKKRHPALALKIAINDEIVIEIPVGVTKVRIALWVQTTKTDEELVAYSSEIDVVMMSKADVEETLEFWMHNEWKHAAGHKLVPLGGEEEDADTRKKRRQKEIEEDDMSGCAKCWKKFKAACWSCCTCGCFFRKPSEDQIMATRGILSLKARRCTTGEAEHDRNVLLALKNVTQGESSLNHSKLERHRDRYIELTEFFGIYLRKEDLTVLQKHLDNMRKVNNELWPSAERRKSKAERDKNVVFRQKKVLDMGIRRQLEDFEEMDTSISTFSRQIERVQDRLRIESNKGITCTPPYMVEKRYISGRKVYTANTERLQCDPDMLVSNVLLDELVKYRLAQTQSAKSIVHYVVLSDHLKPGKNWRPDTIVPHVANLVTHDFEDVPEVRLTGGTKRGDLEDVTFTRQLKQGSSEEATVLNGRLVYRADNPENVFPIDLDDGETDVWLYWDGLCRWVISPYYAMPPPYGLEHTADGENPNLFMWNKDPAVTPDKITNSWMVWGVKRRGTHISAGGLNHQPSAARAAMTDGDGDTMAPLQSELPGGLPSNASVAGKKSWEKDHLIRVLGKAPPKTKGRNFEAYATTLEDEEGKKGGMFSAVGEVVSEALVEVGKLFATSGSQKSDPCLKECLVSLDSSYLTFAWKDVMIERLAPFRKFLLNEFGNYQSAWVYITRKSHIPKVLGVKNLARMFQNVLDQIEREDVEDKERLEDMQDGLETGASGISGVSPTSRATETTSRATGAASPGKGWSLFGGGKKSKASVSPSPATRMSAAQKKKSSESLTASQASWGSGMSPGGRSGGATIRVEPSRYSQDQKNTMRAFLKKKRPWGADGKEKKANPVVGIKGRMTLIREKQQADHEAAGEHGGHQGHDFEILADKLLEIIDRNPKNGFIAVDEIHALYDQEPVEDLLKEFRAFLFAHPMYRDIEYFWEPFSDSLEITLDQFVQATERIMLKFRAVKRLDQGAGFGRSGSRATLGRQSTGAVSDTASVMSRQESDSSVPANTTLTPYEKAQQVFADLDNANMSGGISFSELRPFSGETFEDAERSMLRFPIPLTHVKEIVCQGQVNKFSSDKRCLRFCINHQFENSKPWRNFRTALDPDWEPTPNNESIQVCMSSQFYDLWRQVIKTSEMVLPQEWIRYYDGEYKEHPIITGTYMRHGEGTQRWANGQVYVGQWENHVYEGHGRLWNTVIDFELNKAPPIYEGEWRRGKQHGHGTLRYEQDIQDRRGRAALSRGQHAGISKVYVGGFRHGLFHGRGELKMEKAVAQHLPGRSRDSAESRAGYIPLPILDPASIISFDGIFKSDWKKTDKETREADPVFHSRNPPIKHNKNRGFLSAETEEEKVEHMDLALDELTKAHKHTQRFSRFFDTDKSRVQRAGACLPDLGLATYQLKGGDALHMNWAVLCRYADGTEYEGRLENGKPHTTDEQVTEDDVSTSDIGGEMKTTVGLTTQYEVLPTGERGPHLAKYKGSFKDGERSGVGRHETWDGVVYEGQWVNNKRHGKGKSTVAEKIQDEVGYMIYDGDWQDDMKHGQGKMYFGAGGLLLYDGPFLNDMREGMGSICLLPDKDHSKKKAKDEDKKIIVYKGNFLNDLPHSTDDSPIWSHLVVPGETRGRFFYGKLDHEGKRAGIGTVYDEDADENKEFLACFENGRAYPAEDPNETSTWRYITYHGPFKNDLPHGEGTQHFFNKHDKKHSGIYTGQFVDGRRHGRGTWRTLDDSWKYRPISTSHVANWDKDLMHGIGIVEDREHVHENVIYTHGRCQMPFTDMGPPLTGFDNTVLIGNVMKVARSARKAATSGYGSHGPASSIASTKKSYGIFGGGKEDHAQGVNSLETKAMQMMSQSVVVAKRNNNSSNTDTGSSALSRTEDEEEMEALAMVREETDLTMPEEDVLIKGGTGENAVMNGLYFKLSGTYGLSIYKMAKAKNGNYSKTPDVRYLYKDIKTKCWVIAPKPLAGIILAPACAFVEDEDADRPGTVSVPWYVWMPSKKGMKSPADEEDPDVAAKIDKLSAVSIVGFEIHGMEGTKIKPGLMLRHGRELFGRPVYEAESGGQFLFWMKHKGKLADGMLEDDTELMGGTPDHRKLFASNGFWIIASDVGEVPGGPSCLAYVEDLAVSPDQISEKAQWNVATRQKTDNKGDGYVYEKSTAIRLHAEEWSRNTSTLANFDEEDPTTMALYGGK